MGLSLKCQEIWFLMRKGPTILGLKKYLASEIITTAFVGRQRLSVLHLSVLAILWTNCRLLWEWVDQTWLLQNEDINWVSSIQSVLYSPCNCRMQTDIPLAWHQTDISERWPFLFTLADFDTNVRSRSKCCSQLCWCPVDCDTHWKVAFKTIFLFAPPPTRDWSSIPVWNSLNCINCCSRHNVMIYFLGNLTRSISILQAI
jgi:hypothetical protein